MQLGVEKRGSLCFMVSFCIITKEMSLKKVVAIERKIVFLESASSSMLFLSKSFTTAESIRLAINVSKIASLPLKWGYIESTF